MFKLMIVEDEKRIREGLATGFDWASLGFSVSDTAANGAEAISHFHNSMPDVIMTDIRMPVMDGFELMEHITRLNRKVKFIVLSGYDNFEYAQKAIRYGVTSYLLKPVNENDLYPLMRTLYDDLSVQQRRLVGEVSKTALLKLSRQKVLDDMLRELLHGISRDFRSAEDLLREIAPNFLTTRMSVCVISSENIPDMKKVYQHLIRQRTESKYFFMDADLIVGLQSLGIGNTDNAEITEADWIYSQLKNFSSEADLSLKAVVAQSEAFSGFPMFPGIYKQTEGLLRYRFYRMPGKVIRAPVLPRESELPSNRHMAGVLASAVQNDDEVEAAIRLREYLKSCALQYLPKDILAYKATDIFLLTIKKLERISSLLPDEKTIFERFAMPNTFDEFMRQSDQLCQELFRAYRHYKIIAAQSMVNKVEEYVNAHYGENLSLNSLAEIFHVNASYLSSLFCRKTNIPLTNYIRNVRIENAKRLLYSSDCSIGEIALMVGFREYRHFCTVFKSETGETPKGYRLNSIPERQKE